MPLYLYKCPSCHAFRDIIKSIAVLERTEYCDRCTKEMQRQICAPAVVADYAGYSCPITGHWIEGRRAHENNLKRQGCRVYEPGETEQARRAGREAEAALDKSVDSTVEQFYEALPSAEREALAVAVTSGLDTQIVRK